ncbi:hypothetical protein E2C01_058012 [Portunus trituberculatus]|uniref:Uncharacterized protein n=1 Tax=Portunus trituberculatus TaxID=210409 RepID=A0A5B7H4X2_PORTR|nr:hypothetical protein [Portunus trituberculatus]
MHPSLPSFLYSVTQNLNNKNFLHILIKKYKNYQLIKKITKKLCLSIYLTTDLTAVSSFQVEGTLHKDVKSGGHNNFMENSLNRITPFATKRLKAAARAILATTASRTS